MTAAVEVDRLAQVVSLAAGGLVLVAVPHGTKGPRQTGWNTDPAQWITTPSAARTYLEAHPLGGVGLLHSESQTLALDIDHDGAALALAAVGIDLEELLSAAPYKVRGKRGEKPLYRVPDGLSLKNKALSWPDPSGKKGPGGRAAPLTIFEVRAGPVQDVMPPSIHPDTGTPYTWAGPVPSRREDLPMCPPELLNLLERWAALEGVMKAACPWAEAAPQLAPAPRDLERLGSLTGGGESVIAQFNSSRSLGEVLNMAGYTGGPRGPWLYPHSSSKSAGVRLRPELTPTGAGVVMSWHAADPLGDGKPRDAFAVYALLEHGVDTYSASREQLGEVVKAAARLLGLPEPERVSPRADLPSPSKPTPSALPPLEDWGELTPLPPFTEPVPSLPAEMLPRSLAEWIQSEARAAGLPLEMVAAPVLIGAGGLIGSRLTLRNARNAPAVPANLWGAVCCPPGGRKSHAVKLGGLALERAERREFDRLDAVRPQLEAALERVAAELEALQGSLKRALKGGKGAPELPSDDVLSEAHEAVREATAALEPVRFVVSDATIEKLGILLGGNPYGLTLLRDELTAWLGSFEKAGRESERAQWLELANGDATLRVDRMSRETLHVYPASVSVLGGIQPAPLSKLIDEQTGAGDGLLQRFQVFIWPDTFPAFDQIAQREPVSETVRGGAYGLLDTLGTLDLVTLGSTYPSGDGAPLTYSADAQLIYDAWELQHEAAKRDTKTGEAYRSHLSKQSGTFARLALIFHALDVAALGVSAHPHPAQVGAEPAALAGAWCDYLASHARKLWREGRRLDVLDAREVLRFVERGSVKDGQRVTEARAALAQGKSGMTGDRLSAALSLLERCGAVRVITPPPVSGKGGRPSPLLRLHPQALEVLDSSAGTP